MTWREVRGRPPRKRLPQSVFLQQRVSIELRELPQSAVTEAARVTIADSEKIYFGIEGRFFSDADPAGHALGDPTSYFLRPPRLLTDIPPFSDRLFDIAGRQLTAYELPQTLDQAGIRLNEITFDDADARAAEAARSAAADYAVIDGQLWRRRPEPVWAVYRADGRDPYQLLLSARKPQDGYLQFRLDRLEEAKRYAAVLSKLSRRVFREPAAAVTVRPGMELGDDRVPAAVSVAEQVRDACPDGWLKLLPRRSVEDWGALRRMLAGQARGEPADTDNLCGHAGAIVKAIEDLSLNRFGDHDRCELMKHLLPAIKRWREFEGGSMELPSLDQMETELISAIAL